ncbi:RlpA-like double-psi beta-barrel domain-containing protein [uncultured Deinococcus sp.]|uniref:RlpA-like double-psi beta-barrel domain-containing protein n=1 Tax=uncultured Deinococcus sp. TaxID=158789 RepID=UPI0025E85A27|nr:RlpA-like double-psi beta-barrel domain-containing protein [uncultured Deinococcus sp.]
MRPLAVILGLALLGGAHAQTYTVQPGDTLWSLSRRLGISVAALREANPGMLRAGQTLRMPRHAAVLRTASLPASPPAAVFQRGQAVYYGGRRDPRTAMTAAHLNLPMGTWVRVIHERTGREVTVLVNDRGPFGVPSRIIDLSDDAARVLGIMSEGVAPVRILIVSRP